MPVQVKLPTILRKHAGGEPRVSAEGAMLVARPYHDVKRFRDAADLLIRGLAVEG